MRRALAIFLIGVGAVASAPAAASAQTFTVTKTADTEDTVCDSDCSLRDAVDAANAGAGGDTVMVPAGAYALNTTTLSVAGGTSKTMTIQGVGSDATTLQGDGTHTLITDGAAGGALTLR